MNNNLNILLIGSGAVGSYYIGRIASSKVHITALCRSNYETAKKNGIQIQSINSNFKFIPNAVINSTSEYFLKPDYIIIATKVLPEIDIISMIKNIITPETCIVFLQNGINIEKKVLNAFPKNEIISCLAYITVHKISPAVINHQANGWLTIGKYPNGSSKKVRTLANLFTQSGVKCEIDKNITQARWKKLIWNASYNVISVLGGSLTTKEMTQSNEINSLVINVMQEIIMLANKSGCNLKKSIIDEYILYTSKMPATKTSMLVDYELKRPMEVEAILGNTIEISKKYKITVPYLKTLYSLLKIKNTKNIIK